MVSIIQDPNDTLRATALPVSPEAITSDEVRTVVQKMKKALESQSDGVAIAAPQINVSLRIFVVSKKAIEGADEDITFINPTIIRRGKKKEYMSEGCLSVRWKYGMVKRSTTATVRAYNEEGHEFVMNGKDLLAQIFQHEIDHLDGILFIDSAIDVQDLPPEQE